MMPQRALLLFLVGNCVWVSDFLLPFFFIKTAGSLQRVTRHQFVTTITVSKAERTQRTPHSDVARTVHEERAFPATLAWH